MIENKEFLDFYFIYNYGFSAQFLNTMSITSALCTTNVLSQEDSNFHDPVLQGAKTAFFFSLNAIILQPMWSIFLKKIYIVF
jgi:hypothetical protein